MESLRTIRVYGRLARFLGQRTFQAAVSSAAEAVRFLLVNFPRLEAHMTQQHYRVSVGGYALDAEELHHPSGQQVIRIVPVLTGAGPVGRIVAGVALVAGAILLGPAGGGFLGLGAGWGGAAGTAAGFGTGLLGGVASTIIGGIGATLVLQGVSSLLTPVPTTSTGEDSAQDPRKSFSFSGVQQTSRQGVPVPICYGRTLLGSVVVSAGVDTVQVG
jgi:predicted phage tail protein